MVKRVAGAVYAHRSNIRELAGALPDDEGLKLEQFLAAVSAEGIPYDVVKYSKGAVTLIESPDWDSANEPTVGISRRWTAGMWMDHGRVSRNFRIQRNGKQVYHNKWQFVGSDYTGFDLEAAKRRTSRWNSLPGVDKTRIGNKEFWKKFLEKNGMEV